MNEEPTLESQIQVSAGYSHSCALLQDGTVWCWGSNYHGQLGDGTEIASSAPVQVSGITTATRVSAGHFHSCALLQDGTVWCWGRNHQGQLGTGTTTDSSTPVQVSGITTATQVSAGYSYSCALLQDGTVRCWGWNGFGQLGTGTTTDSSTPVQVSGITTATQVSAGESHSCALLQDGTVWCWGSNSFGQLGNGAIIDSSYSSYSSTPVQVSGITTATQVSAGHYHSCATLQDGTVWCWGDNDSGQLGDGTTSNSSAVPVQVSGISTATQISAGHYHSCATLQDGTVWYWGRNLWKRDSTYDLSDMTIRVFSPTILAILLQLARRNIWGRSKTGQPLQRQRSGVLFPLRCLGYPRQHRIPVQVSEIPTATW